jgi:hypothetical protein
VIDPGRYDITIHQGATFELNLQLKDSAGSPVDMTGYTVAAKLYNQLGTELISAFSFAWTVQASGSFVLSIPSVTTAVIVQNGQYDILVTEPTGKKYYLLEGTAFLNPGLTGKA